MLWIIMSSVKMYMTYIMMMSEYYEIVCF